MVSRCVYFLFLLNELTMSLVKIIMSLENLLAMFSSRSIA